MLGGAAHLDLLAQVVLHGADCGRCHRPVEPSLDMGVLQADALLLRQHDGAEGHNARQLGLRARGVTGGGEGWRPLVAAARALWAGWLLDAPL